MQLRDNLTLDTGTARICADGCLVANVRAARIGIQDYLGREVDPEGKRFAADARVKVYRPEEEVFNRDSMASFAATPFTIDHPSQPVTADNWRSLGVGDLGSEVVRDGDFVRVPLIVRDASAVAKVRDTHRELSMGYTCDLDWTPGAVDGHTYDAIQRNIRINHIAAVPNARGGSELKITDERPSPERKTMKTILIDGIPVSLSDADQVAAAIGKLQTAVADGETKLATANTAISAKDGEIAALKKELSDAKALSEPAAIDKRVADRAALVATAKGLVADVAIDGVSDANIRKAVVDAKLGDHGLDDAGIAGAFAVLANGLTVDDNKVVNITAPIAANDAAANSQKAFNARNERYATAYRGPAQK